MSRFGNALLQLGLYRYMVFTVSRFGRPVIELGPHRFNKWAYSRGARASWTCVKQYKQSNFHHYMDREQGFEYRPLSIKQKKLLQWQPSDVDLQSTGQRVSRSSVHDRQRHNTEAPVFTTSRYGKPVIQLGRYRYNKWVGSQGRRARWPCVKLGNGCKAVLITCDDQIVQVNSIRSACDLRYDGIEHFPSWKLKRQRCKLLGLPIFSTSARGNPVLNLGKYRYYCAHIGNESTRWICIKVHSLHCPAKATTCEDMVIKIILMESRCGRPVIQIGQYRFNQWSGSRGQRKRWICVKVHNGCPATLVTIDDEIVKSKPHNH
ncbi:hypothetical protein MSG28_008194 [Choristoneura fumiferana]|uniref:Uncharacterized protein n=1 Tax=Choristoneura fumiferana TaxID=7141 RepID=A0ACC0JAD7_CHOFU|nr:hypothetical protein MSG28_008194 [Choristoneura fumiferana]